ERERAPGVRGRGPMRIARAPEERAARLAEAIERADEREIPQRFLLEAGACCEIVETPERSAAPALLDDRLRLRIAESLHALEPEPHVVNATCPMGRDRPRCVDWMRRRGRRGFSGCLACSRVPSPRPVGWLGAPDGRLAGGESRSAARHPSRLLSPVGTGAVPQLDNRFRR